MKPMGVPTVIDILQELEKPGRDPRPIFKTATFREGVEKLDDLKPGMILEGVVTNVAAFGAFVDVGVHQDGLVHISAMAKSALFCRSLTEAASCYSAEATMQSGSPTGHVLCRFSGSAPFQNSGRAVP